VESELGALREQDGSALQNDFIRISSFGDSGFESMVSSFGDSGFEEFAK
jgi:hypothetical protein